MKATPKKDQTDLDPAKGKSGTPQVKKGLPNHLLAPTKMKRPVGVDSSEEEELVTENY